MADPVQQVAHADPDADLLTPPSAPVAVVKPLTTPTNSNTPGDPDADLLVPPPAPKQSSSGASVEPMNDWQKGVGNLLKEVGQGVKEFNISINYANVAIGTMSQADAVAQEVNDNRIFRAPNEEDEINGPVFANIMHTMGDKLAQIIPGLGASAGAIGVGSLATGMAMSAPPAVAGGALVAGVTAFGSQVRKSLQLHEDLPTARLAGAVSGGFNGALAMVGMGAATKGIGDIAALQSPTFKQLAVDTITTLGKASGINFGTQGASAVLGAITNFVTSKMSAGAKDYTTRDGLNDIGESVKDALYTIIPTTLGIHALGHALKPIVGAPAQVKALTDYFNLRATELHEKQVTAELKGHVDRAVDKSVEGNKEKALEGEAEAAQKLSDAHKMQDDAWRSPFSSSAVIDQLQASVDDAKKKLAEAKAAVDRQPNAQEIAQQKAQTLAEATRIKLQEEGYIERTVTKAVAATSILKGVAKDVLKAAQKALKEGRALTENEKLALDRKVWLSKSSAEVRHEVLRGLQKLSIRALKQAGSIFPWSNTAGWTQVTHEGLLQIAFQYHPNGEAMARELSVEESVNHYNAQQQHYESVLTEHLTAATGLNKGGLEKLAHKASGDMCEIVSKGADGEDHTFKLTADECMFYLSLMKNAKAKVALTNDVLGNNFTTNESSPNVNDTTENVMRDVLWRKDPSYIHALKGFEEFYDDPRVGEQLKESFEANNPGQELPLEPKGTYGAQVVRRGDQLRKPVDLTPFFPGEEYTTGAHLDKGDPAQTKLRGGSSIYIEKAGAFERATQRTRQQAAYDAYYEPSKLWNAFVNSGARHNITVQFGDHLWNAIKDGYENTVHNPVPDAVEKVTNHFLRMQAIHWFAANPVMGAKHLTTIGNFALTKYKGRFIPAEALTAGIAKANANWDATAKFVMAQPAVKERYTKVEKLGAYTREDSPGTLAVKLQKGSMGALQWGDKQVMIAGYKAVYDWVLKESGSSAIAHKEATRAFQHVLASGESHQQSIMSKNGILQMLGFGQQPKRRLAQNVLEARRLAVNFPTPENIGNAVRVSAISSMAAFLFKMPDVAVSSALFAATGAAVYQQKADEAWFQAFQDLRLGNMFSLGGAAVTAADTQLANDSGVFDTKFHIWEPSLPIIKAAGATWRFAESMNAHILGGKEWTGNDILTTLLQAVQGPGALLPIPEKPVQGIKTTGDEVLGQ